MHHLFLIFLSVLVGSSVSGNKEPAGVKDTAADESRDCIGWTVS